MKFFKILAIMFVCKLCVYTVHTYAYLQNKTKWPIINYVHYK